MNIVGIIIEANPLHNGHLYFINEVKKQYQPDLLVALTTTSFTMRGEISVIDKFEKSNALLKAGIDVVLEFPFILSTQSSDYFALNALTILSSFGVNHLICGCETDNIDIFNEIYNIELNTKFNDILKEKLTKYDSYKSSFSKAFAEYGIEDPKINIFSQPNFTLAYQYFKVIKNKYPQIAFSLIKRTNNYHDLRLNNRIVSAKAIREGILHEQDINKFVPFSYHYTNIKRAESNLYTILNYKISQLELISRPFDKEGITNYIIKNINFSNSYAELIENLKNKRYSVSRINRSILYIIQNIIDFHHEARYLRILAINNLGIKYISNLDDSIKNLIFAGINEINADHPNYEIANYELQATKTFAIVTENKNIILNEYKFPIRKKEK